MVSLSICQATFAFPFRLVIRYIAQECVTFQQPEARFPFALFVLSGRAIGEISTIFPANSALIAAVYLRALVYCV
jgi:hypothetical protein